MPIYLLISRIVDRDKTDEPELGGKFVLHSWLKDEDRELDCLRNVSDALLLNLMSKPYGSCAPIRHLLREIFASSGMNKFVLTIF